MPDENIHIPFEGMTIEEEIGSGSYGTVYRAAKSGRDLAVKVIRISRNEKVQGDAARQRESTKEEEHYIHHIAEDIRKEIQALEKLKGNRNIVSIEDYRIIESESGVEIYILMEYLKPFTEYESEHDMKEADVVRMGIDLCSALEACEETGLLHRDLKPDNILVSEDGIFKICDFGTAKILEKTYTENSVKGTFTYMAPEVYHGRKYNSRADLYSLGMILYRTMNRGREPFIPGDQRMVYYKDKETALNRRMNGESLPAPIDASEEFSDILMKTCAYYPEKRYTSASNLKKDLIRFLQGTYRKSSRSVKNGKRTKAFYCKVVFLFILSAALLGIAAKAAWWHYQEYIVNLCDTDMQKYLRDKYGLNLTARLNGNGVLYINSNDDLYCEDELWQEKYPWMNRKPLIRTIVFGENVTELAARNIETVDREPDGVPNTTPQTIFRNCENLEEIVFKGKSIYLGGTVVFEGDRKLKSITCSEDADVEIELGSEFFQDIPWYEQEEQCILGNLFVRYNGTEAKLRLPDNIRRIACYAFDGNDSLETVYVPDDLEVIGSFAFRGCSSLRSLIVPESVSSIGFAAFSGCKNLTDLELLSGNPDYKMIDGIVIDEKQNSILWCSPKVGDTLRIPENIEKIEGGALDICTAWKLVIPDGFTDMSSDGFGVLKSLTDVDVSESNTSFSLDNGILYYNREGTSSIQADVCLKNTKGHVEVKEGTAVIYEYCFSSCKNITSVTLPDTVEAIMSYAFENCSGLQSIEIPSSVRLMTNHVFDGCGSLKDIYYGGTREEWENLANHYGAGVDETKVIVHCSGEK